MNKSLLASTIFLTLGIPTAQAISYSSTGNNFSMLLPDGTPAIGGTNDVIMNWDGSLNTSASDTNINMTLSSTSTFFSQLWNAHDIRVFGPGTYTFEACTPGSTIGDTPCEDVTTPDPITGIRLPITMTVEANQIGAHMLFDWNTAFDIDLVNVWDMNSVFGGAMIHPPSQCGSDCGNTTTDPWSGDPLNVWDLASTNDDGVGGYGTTFIDGPFATAAAGNFNLMLVPIPVPAAIWLLASGLVGLLGLYRRRD